MLVFEDADIMAACSSCRGFQTVILYSASVLPFLKKIGPQKKFLVTVAMNVQSVSKKSSARTKDSFKDPNERS